ncbi:MAG: hypothetical protein JWO74_2167 [Solirubrobacterales bacterium]|nr:hypothetical protein [Solirubrobacterales bacterium]
MLRRGLTGISIVVAALALSCEPGIGVGERHVSSDQLGRDRNRVEDLALKRFRDSYACAVIADSMLRVYVTNRSAIEKANKIRRTLQSAAQVRVLMTSERFQFDTIRDIRHRLERALPASGSGIGIESPLGRRTCPRVRLQVLPKGQASPEAEKWAADAQRRYGSDRVVVHRAPASIEE